MNYIMTRLTFGLLAGALAAALKYTISYTALPINTVPNLFGCTHNYHTGHRVGAHTIIIRGTEWVHTRLSYGAQSGLQRLGHQIC